MTGISCVLAVGLSLSHPSLAGNNTWTGGNGPYAEFVTTVTTTGATTPATVYIGPGGSADGLLRWSTDGGVTWAGGGAGLPDASGFVVAAGAPTTLFSASSTGVFKSTNGGATWAVTPRPSAGCIAGDPGNGAVLFAGTSMNVFKSTDSGASWAQISPSPGFTTRSIAVDPVATSNVYTLTGPLLYRSTNSGGGWTPAGTGLPANGARTLVIDPVTRTTLYAGASGGGVWKSTDSGSTFTLSSSGLANLANVAPLVIDSAAPSTLLAGTTVGVYKSTDAGVTWGASGLSKQVISSLAQDRSAANAYYAGTYGGPFRTTDGGQSWTRLNTGIAMAPFFSAADYFSPSTFYLGGHAGLFKSTDDGASFTEIGASLPTARVGAILASPADPDSLVVAGSTIQRTTDGGASWQPASSPPAGTFVHELIRNPAVASTLHAGTTAGFWTSTDGGDTWAGEIGDGTVTHLAVDPSNASRIYGSVGFELYKSTDGGASFMDTAFPPTGIFGIFAIGLAVDGTVYVGTDATLKKSTDGGGSWSDVTPPTPNPFINVILPDPSSASSLVVGADGGIYQSTNGGGFWTPLMSGIDALPFRGAQTMSRSPVDPAKLFAGIVSYGGFSYRTVPAGSALVANGSFASSLDDWTPTSGSAAWSPLDAGGDAGSGSALVTSDAAIGRLVQACTGLTDRDRVNFGAKVRVPSGQTATGTATVTVSFTSDPFCTTPLSTISAPAISPIDTWQTTSLAHVAPPASARGALLSIDVTKSAGTGSFSAHLDDVFFTADRHGDANGDGSVSVADVFYLINSLFAGGSAPVGPGDVNGDGSVTVADVFYLINHLFAGGPPPL